LLGLYQQILQQGEIAADDGSERIELRLSGLIVKREGKLKVYNPIYQEVFNQGWIDEEFKKIRPGFYGEALKNWVDSNYQEESWLLQGEALKEAKVWIHERGGNLDNKYLRACYDLEVREARKALAAERQVNQILMEAHQKARRRIFLGSAIFFTSLVGAIALWLFSEHQIKNRALQERISLGEETLIKSNTTANQQAGVEAFVKKDFQEAAKQFQRSRELNSNDPEALIYLNNAKIRNAQAYKIVVSVPIGTNLNVAREILRGVAQAQDEINNRQGGIKEKLLKVEIANDDNNPDIAQQLAGKFVGDSNIIAVVGHNASNASIPAAPIYNQGGLVMVSPTSFAQELSKTGKYTFRTVPSINILANTLAENTIKKLHKNQIAFCIDSRSKDNQSYKEEYENAASKYGGKLIPLTCDISDPNLNPDKIIKQAIDNGADSLMLAAYIDSIKEAVKIAEANLKKEKKLQIFASPTLYTRETLEAGRSEINGMILIAPWVPDSNPQFSEKANQYWGGDVTWRTAMAYDATLAIAEGLKQSDGTREGLQKALSNPSFEVKNGATGTVKFLTSGDRIGTGVLVQIRPGNKSGTGYDFVPLKP
jgi:branched-chain amino acid transport system substrate-binding protein